VWYKEEIELAVNNFRLLNESLVNIGSLRRISDVRIGLFKESLSHSLVDNYQSDMWE
jgi:reverse gyrase